MLLFLRSTLQKDKDYYFVVDAADVPATAGSLADDRGF
jgi:hypothetical protein